MTRPTIECRCDCIECVTGNHHQCYYTNPDGSPTCPFKAAWDSEAFPSRPA